MHFSEIAIAGVRAVYSGPYKKTSKIQINPGLVNIIIGENGAGKSTILDAIHSLCESSKLCGLQTENTIASDIAECLFVRGCTRIELKFCQHGADFFNFQNAAVAIDGILETSKSKFSNKGWVKIPKSSVSNSQELNDLMSMLSPYGQDIIYIGRNSKLLSGDDFSVELNNIGPLLIGLASELKVDKTHDDFEIEVIRRPVRFDQSKNQFRVYLKSDLRQPSLVPLENLPSGWVRYGTVCSLLSSVSENSVVLLDEPELNLHPKLQHRMIQRICEIACSKNIQAFIATHSNIFINAIRWGKVDINIFSARGQSACQVDNCSEVLERLGFKASDLLQTDGVIWVEGPSDRLYIEYWLDKWCETNGKQRYQENVDYCYSFYGGSILSHFQAGEESDLIDLLKINKNAFVVIDNDNDFSFISEIPVAVSGDSAKERIFKSVQASGGGAWITKNYTVESYLVSSFREQNFDFIDGKLVLKDGKRKVDVAERYKKQKLTAKDILAVDDLNDRIKELYGNIESWSSFN